MVNRTQRPYTVIAMQKKQNIENNKSAANN